MHNGGCLLIKRKNYNHRCTFKICYGLATAALGQSDES